MKYKTERVSFTRTIHRFIEGNEVWDKTEIALQPEDNTPPLEVHAEAKRLVIEALNDNQQPRYEHVANNRSVPIKEVEKGDTIAFGIQDIQSCSDVKVLESYKFLVRGNAELSEAYRKKLIELSPK